MSKLSYQNTNMKSAAESRDPMSGFNARNLISYRQQSRCDVVSAH